jgi:hypothetical protein
VSQNIEIPPLSKTPSSQLEDMYDRQQSQRGPPPNTYLNVSQEPQVSYLQQQHMMQENAKQQQQQPQYQQMNGNYNSGSQSTSQAVSPQPVQRVTIQQAGTTRHMMSRNANSKFIRS